MRRFFAAAYKDLCLFFQGAGIAAFLAPFLLLGFFYVLFMYEEEAIPSFARMEPFPIAIRDEDETMMTRVLMDQVREVELFSEVYRVQGESDEELLEKGYAAITTIPKDYFYEMYDFSDCPATLVLNDDMPLQAGIYRTIFTSVMEVVRADQAAQAAAFSHLYGEAADKQALYAAISEDLFRDLLSRQAVFDVAEAGSDEMAIRLRRLLVTLIIASVLLFMTAAAATIPTEQRQRVLPRWRAFGGSALSLAAPRFVTALFLMTPVVAVGALVFGTEHPVRYLAACYGMALAVFLLMAAFACVVRNAHTVRAAGNLLLVAALFFGGSLLQILPGGAQGIAVIVVDEEGSASSRELTERLFATAGIAGSVEASMEEARERLNRGQAEGILCIRTGYEAYLKADGESDAAPLYYEGSLSAQSAEGVRELAAAISCVQTAGFRAVRIVERESGMTLTDAQRKALTEEMEARAAHMPPLYRMRNAQDGAADGGADPLTESGAAFGIFILVLVLFTAASRFGTREHSRVRLRLRSVRHGTLYLYGKEVGRLLLTGAVVSAVLCLILFPSSGEAAGSDLAKAFTALVFIMTCVSLILVRLFPAAERTDLLAPTMALILCLAGGCFLNLQALSPGFARIMRATPTGLALLAAGGDGKALAILFGLAPVLLLCYAGLSAAASRSGTMR